MSRCLGLGARVLHHSLSATVRGSIVTFLYLSVYLNLSLVTVSLGRGSYLKRCSQLLGLSPNTL